MPPRLYREILDGILLAVTEGSDMDLRTPRGFTLIELMFVVLITMTVAAIAIPMSGNLIGFFRLSGDVRKTANAVAVTKMRAASDFTQARLYVDLDTPQQQFHMETYQKTAKADTGKPGWVSPGGITTLSPGVRFGFGSISETWTAPPQPPIQAQAQKCRNDEGMEIDGTACIVFNSRGTPIDCTSIDPTGVPPVGCTPAAPYSNNALYLTDNTAVYAITVLATGMMETWKTPPNTVSWSKQ